MKRMRVICRFGFAFLTFFAFQAVPILSQAKETRPTISVLDFTVSGISQAESTVFVDFMSATIVDTGRYRVIDRMQRASLLKEIEFSKSNCSDENCQLEIGKLLSANQIIVGSLGKVGDRFFLTIKLIEVATGETLKNASKKYNSLNDMLDDSQILITGFISSGGTEAAKVPEASGKTEPKPAAPSQAAASPAAEVVKEEPKAVVAAQPAAPSTVGVIKEETKAVPAVAPSQPESTGSAGTQSAASPQRSGWSFDIQAGEAISSFLVPHAAIGTLYQFNNWFSLGCWLGIYLPGYVFPAGGVKLVFGNKVDGFALSANLGLYPSIGLYFHNWYLNVMLFPGSFGEIDLGYSFYFGK